MKRKTVFSLVSLLVALSLLLGACASPTETPTEAPPDPPKPTEPAPTKEPEPVGTPESPPTPEPLIFTDGLGREITLEQPAQMVVSLAPSNTEILFAVGAGEQVIGRDEFSNYPAEAMDLPSIGGSFGEYNLEAIIALEPDLILAAEINTAELVQSLEDLGLTVYYLSNPLDIEGMYANLEIVAQLTGHADETAELVTGLRTRVEAVMEVVAEAETAPTVFYELDGFDPNAPWTVGGGTFTDTLITMLGAVNVGAVMEGPYGQLSLEELIAQDPDIIILGDANFGATPEAVAARPGWETLSAVQNGMVFAFNDDLASRPGPRLVDGLETLAMLFYPELFEE